MDPYDPNNPFHHENVKRVGDLVAKDMGHTGVIDYSHEEPTFELGGTTRKTAGRYFPEDKRVALYTKHLHDPASVEDVLAHEIGHAKYHSVYNLLNKEGTRIKKNPEHYERHKKDDWSPDMEKAYPVGAKLRKFDLAELAKTGNFTPYIKDKWQAVKEGKASRGHALDESHAELAMLHRQAKRQATGFTSNKGIPNPDKENMTKAFLLAQGIKKPWIDFHDTIDQIYREHTSKQRSNLIRALGIKR